MANPNWSMDTHNQWIRWSIVLTGALGVVGAVWLPPVVDEPIRSAILQGFAGLCHQLPARSLHVDGVPLAVCDRCLGIYGGVLLGVLAMPLVPGWARKLQRNAGLAIVVALVPLAVDWFGPVAGGWSNVPLSRAVTGGWFGSAAGLLVAYAVVSAGRRAAEADARASDPS